MILLPIQILVKNEIHLYLEKHDVQEDGFAMNPKFKQQIEIA
jgi:hypothetical protein